MPKGTKWTKEAVAALAVNFEKRAAFQKAHSAAYGAAYKAGWLSEICAHMKVDGRAGNTRNRKKKEEVVNA